MRTLSSFKDNEIPVSTPQNEIVFIGPPSKLYGDLILENKSDEELFIQDLSIDEFTGKKNAKYSLRVKSHLGPRQIRSGRIVCKADPYTKPGTYKTKMKVGKSEKKATIIVQNNLDVELRPNRLYFSGIKPGIIHTGQIMFVNKGNFPILVPNVKHATVLDADLFCRNLSKAIRKSGNEGALETIDTFVKGVRKDMADWVSVTVEPAGKKVLPGQGLLLTIILKLPKDVDPKCEYRGEMRMYNHNLGYTITPQVV